jgi:hypothetical protein
MPHLRDHIPAVKNPAFFPRAGRRGWNYLRSDERPSLGKEARIFFGSFLGFRAGKNRDQTAAVIIKLFDIPSFDGVLTNLRLGHIFSPVLPQCGGCY